MSLLIRESFNLLREGLNRSSAFLLPHICVLCGCQVQNSIDLCFDCKKLLPWIKKHCKYCATILPDQQEGETDICGRCLTSSPVFNSACALFSYQKLAAKMIIDLKFKEKLYLTSLLGRLLAKKLQRTLDSREYPQAIIPMPLHSSRLRERGFNQAKEIARPISKLLKIPIDDSICQRIKKTKEQSSLSAKMRFRNVANSFRASNKFYKRTRVAIVDDVVTTYATSQSLAKELKLVGVKDVSLWICMVVNL